MERVSRFQGSYAPRPGLTASGLFIVNPPHLAESGIARGRFAATAATARTLERGQASFTLDSGGTSRSHSSVGAANKNACRQARLGLFAGSAFLYFLSWTFPAV